MSPSFAAGGADAAARAIPADLARAIGARRSVLVPVVPVVENRVSFARQVDVYNPDRPEFVFPAEHDHRHPSSDARTTLRVKPRGGTLGAATFAAMGVGRVAGAPRSTRDRAARNFGRNVHSPFLQLFCCDSYCQLLVLVDPCQLSCLCFWVFGNDITVLRDENVVTFL